MQTFVSLQSDSLTLPFSLEKSKILQCLKTTIWEIMLMSKCQDMNTPGGKPSHLTLDSHTAGSSTLTIPLAWVLTASWIWDELHPRASIYCTNEKQNPDNQIHSNRHLNVDRWIPAAVMMHPTDTAIIHRRKNEATLAGSYITEIMLLKTFND